MLYDMSINAEQVRALRESRGWSQEHLAEVAGLSLRTIQRVEAEGKGSRETKLSLAAAFDVPLGRLSVVTAGDLNAGQGAGTASMSLIITATLLILAGLFAGVNAGIIIAGAAILVSGVAVHAMETLNSMRRAAGLSPLLGAPTAIAGFSILLSGTMVLLLGLSVTGQLWWMPGGVLAGIGIALMLSSWALRLVGGEPNPS